MKESARSIIKRATAGIRVVPCATCLGNGKLYGVRCPVCKGCGKTTTDELEIRNETHT